MNPFEELKQIQAALKREEDRLERVKRNKTDWDDPNARLAYVRDLKRLKRRKLIERLSPGMRCPVCKEVKTNSRQWIVAERINLQVGPIQPKVAVCRSCVMAGGW